MLADLAKYQRAVGDLLTHSEILTHLTPEEQAIFDRSIFDIDVQKEFAKIPVELKRDNPILDEYFGIALEAKKKWKEDQSKPPEPKPAATAYKSLRTLHRNLSVSQADPTPMKVAHLFEREAVTDPFVLQIRAHLPQTCKPYAQANHKDVYPSIEQMVGSIRLLSTAYYSLISPIYRHELDTAMLVWAKFHQTIKDKLKAPDSPPVTSSLFSNLPKDPKHLKEQERKNKLFEQLKYSHQYAFGGKLKQVFRYWDVKDVFRACFVVFYKLAGLIRSEASADGFEVVFGEFKFTAASTLDDLLGVCPGLRGRQDYQLMENLFLMIKQWLKIAEEQLADCNIRNPQLEKQFNLSEYLSSILRFIPFADSLNNKEMFSEVFQFETETSDALRIKIPYTEIEQILQAEIDPEQVKRSALSTVDVKADHLELWLLANYLQEDYVRLSHTVVHLHKSVVDMQFRLALFGGGVSQPFEEITRTCCLDLCVIELVSEVNACMKKRGLRIEHFFDLQSSFSTQVMDASSSAEATAEKLDEEAVYQFFSALLGRPTTPMSKSERVLLDEQELQAWTDELIGVVFRRFFNSQLPMRLEILFLEVINSKSWIAEDLEQDQDALVAACKTHIASTKQRINALQTNELRVLDEEYLESLMAEEANNQLLTTQPLLAYCLETLELQRAASVRAKSFYSKLFDLMEMLCEEVICKENVQKKKDRVYQETEEVLAKMNRENKNLPVEDKLRLMMENDFTLDEEIRKKWHPVRRLRPELKDNNEFLIEMRVWNKVWPFIEKAHWKVAASDQVQTGFVTWFSLMVYGSDWEEDVLTYLRKARFDRVHTIETAIKVLSVVSDASKSCYQLYPSSQHPELNSIPWWVFSSVDNGFGYLEEGDLRDWKKEYILNFTEWVLDDKQEYYGGGYTLDYEFALNMEVFMGLFRPTHTRSSHQ